MEITNEQRDEMVLICSLRNGYSESYYEKMSDADLLHEYKNCLEEEPSWPAL